MAATLLYAHPDSNAELVEYDMSEHASVISDAVESVRGSLDVRPTLPGMFGKEARMNRNHGFFCEPGVSHGYFFSRQLAAAKPITDVMASILDIVNSKFGKVYNGVLVNEYMDGEDYISDHRDNEVGLTSGQDVIAISWGASRTLRIKVWDDVNNAPRTKREGGWVCDAKTKSCTALQMKGSDFQRVLSHGVPKQKNAGRRVSLTFRKHDKLKEKIILEQRKRQQQKSRTLSKLIGKH